MSGLAAELAGVSARIVWRQAFRLARNIRCPIEGVVHTAYELDADDILSRFPPEVASAARTAAWCGKSGDTLKYGIRFRAAYHRAGINIHYITSQSVTGRVRLPR